MLRKLILISLIAMLSFAIIGCSGDAESETDNLSNNVAGAAVAIVNGQEISVQDFESTLGSMKAMYAQNGIDLQGEESMGMLQEVEQQVLNNLISMEVLRQEAESKGLEVTEVEVNNEIDELKLQFGTSEEFEVVLEANNLTLDQLRKSIESEILVDKYIENEIPEPTVTEEEAIALYEQYSMTQEDMPAFAEVRVQIEAEIRQDKLNLEVSQIIQALKEESTIEILI